MIGLLGGTFDPVHFGHLRPAQEVCDVLSLQQLRFMPAANPPHRAPPVASIAHRIAMLRLAIVVDERFELDDREQYIDGPSYTVRTLESLREDLGQCPLALVIGADQFRAFESWYRWQDILELAHLVVMNRPGNEMLDLPPWAGERLSGESEQLDRLAGGRIRQVTVTPVNISATAIRQALASGLPASDMLPGAVLEYIETNKLYRELPGQ